MKREKDFLGTVDPEGVGRHKSTEWEEGGLDTGRNWSTGVTVEMYCRVPLEYGWFKSMFLFRLDCTIRVRTSDFGCELTKSDEDSLFNCNKGLRIH